MVVNTADKLANRKLVITPQQVDKLPLAYCWAYGIETLVISSIQKDTKPLTVFISRSPKDIEKKMQKPDNFMPADFETSFNQNNLNSNYFSLPQQKYIFWDKTFGE